MRCQHNPADSRTGYQAAQARLRAQNLTKINEAQRTKAHREIAVTDLETYYWKIPHTAEALKTTGLPEAVRLALLRAEVGQVLGSNDAEEEEEG